MKRKFLASILCILIYPNPLNADGIVFDPSVYGQAVATVSQLASQAATQANQYAKQLLQYQTQLQQYETQLQQYQNMVTNTLAPAAYIWDQANATISKVVGIVDTIDNYANQAGGLQNYLAQFQNSSYYRSSPCYTATGCPPDYLQTLTNQQNTGSAAQKSANDALLTMVQQQQTPVERRCSQFGQFASECTGRTRSNAGTRRCESTGQRGGQPIDADSGDTDSATERGGHHGRSGGGPASPTTVCRCRV